MRNYILSTTAFAACLAVSSAESFAASDSVDWTGAHAGVNLGYSWMNNNDNITGTSVGGQSFLTDGELPSSLKVKADGTIGGAQIGYDKQITPMWVIGAEADLAAISARGSTTEPSPNGDNRTMTAVQSLDMFGTVRARVGATHPQFGNILIYGTGGLAYGNGKLSTAVGRLSGCAGNNCENGSESGAMVGWTAGGGVEYAFQGPWSVKAEYLYYDLGSESHPMTDPNFAGNTFSSKASFTGNIVRLGLNYKFD